MIATDTPRDAPKRGAFGQGMYERRRYHGLTQELAAHLAEISRARWAQLELGYECKRDDAGNTIKVVPSTTHATVRAIARVLHWDLADAYRAAGLDPDDEPLPPVVEIADRDRKTRVLERINKLSPAEQDSLVVFLDALKRTSVDLPGMRAAS